MLHSLLVGIDLPVVVSGVDEEFDRTCEVPSALEVHSELCGEPRRLIAAMLDHQITGLTVQHRDYNLIHAYGGTTSTIRSSAETEIGLFWTEHTGQQYARMLNSLVDTYHLGTADSARLMAVVWTGFSDAAIGCFNAKYKYGFWRPATAVPAGSGNSDLTADSSWLPLGPTPAHPEYPAAHGCVTGALSSRTAGFFGTTHVHVVTDSLAFTDGVHQHIFEDTRDLMDEVFWARIYAGFHYHHSLEVGRQLERRWPRS